MFNYQHRFGKERVWSSMVENLLEQPILRNQSLEPLEVIWLLLLEGMHPHIVQHVL